MDLGMKGLTKQELIDVNGGAVEPITFTLGLIGTITAICALFYTIGQNDGRRNRKQEEVRDLQIDAITGAA